MSDAILDVQTRKEKGKGNARKLRREGKIPGVYYFHGKESIPVTIEHTDLIKMLHDESGLITIRMDKKDEKKCIVREVQVNPLTQIPIHIDFMGISLTEKITVTVPLHLKGTPAGVKEGGILNHILREVEIECLPTDIPEKFEMDVTDLQIGDSLQVSDLKVEKFEILADMDQTVATVTPPRLEEEADELEEEELLEGEEEPQEPEVISQKREQEEEEEEA